MKTVHPNYAYPNKLKPGESLFSFSPAEPDLAITNSEQLHASIKRSHLSMFMAYQLFLKEGATRNWEPIVCNYRYSYI